MVSNRCVSRICYLYRKQTYYWKLSGTPRLSKYSFRAFSFSSSVSATLYFVYNSLITKASSFCSNPFCISGKNSSCSSKKYLTFDKCQKQFLWNLHILHFSFLHPFRDGCDDCDDIFTIIPFHKIPSQSSHIVTLLLSAPFFNK